eukprot:5738991-Prymnesium_polylepis.1
MARRAPSRRPSPCATAACTPARGTWTPSRCCWPRARRGTGGSSCRRRSCPAACGSRSRSRRAAGGRTASRPCSSRSRPSRS